MFPLISSRQYKLDRIRWEKRCSLGMAVILLLLAGNANAQTPAPQPPIKLSIEYYQHRILELDANAAVLTYENAQLKRQVEMLTKQLAEKKAEPPK